MRFVMTVFLLTAAAVIGIIVLEPVSSDYRRQSADEKLLKQKLARLRDENTELKKEIYRMKNDPFYLEKYARDAFGLARSNEYIYKFD